MLFSERILFAMVYKLMYCYCFNVGRLLYDLCVTLSYINTDDHETVIVS